MDTESLYLEMRESYQGWCNDCQEVTRDNTEPDAEEYDCPVCENDSSVVGADVFLIENA